MKAKFNSKCTACGCYINVGEEIEYVKGRGSRHATVEACMLAKKSRLTIGPSIDLTPVREFLKAAQDRGLKAPKLRVLSPDKQAEMRLSITRGGQAPGSVALVETDPGGADIFLGCVRPDGVTVGALARDTKLQEYLLRVAKNPINAAKEYAALAGNCCFCGKKLEDEGSVEAGYGPVCAQHWGLPHRAKGVKNVGAAPEVD